MAKLNCWEFKKCGYEQGGTKVTTAGVCPASIEVCMHGLNGGRFAGRTCWVISGTLCNGVAQGTFATKMSSCMKCDFFNQVVHEEGEKLVKMIDLVHKLKEKK